MNNKTQERNRSEDEKNRAKGADTGNRPLPENSKEELDERLDEGVEETFPASDPVSVKITK